MADESSSFHIFIPWCRSADSLHRPNGVCLLTIANFRYPLKTSSAGIFCCVVCDVPTPREDEELGLHSVLSSPDLVSGHLVRSLSLSPFLFCADPSGAFHLTHRHALNQRFDCPFPFLLVLRLNSVRAVFFFSLFLEPLRTDFPPTPLMSALYLPPCFPDYSKMDLQGPLPPPPPQICPNPSLPPFFPLNNPSETLFRNTDPGVPLQRSRSSFPRRVLSPTVLPVSAPPRKPLPFPPFFCCRKVAGAFFLLYLTFPVVRYFPGDVIPP